MGSDNIGKLGPVLQNIGMISWYSGKKQGKGSGYIKRQERTKVIKYKIRQCCSYD